MIIILFVTMIFVSGYNIIPSMTKYSPTKYVEYHILNKTKHINEKGINIKEVTLITQEDPIKYEQINAWIDIQHITSTWNKLIPSID